MHFRDRRDAGIRLAAALERFKGEAVIVYALPRGGVVLGVEVAHSLHAPLDLLIPRKIGHPFNPEYAIAAVTERGEPVIQSGEISRVDPGWYRQAVAKAKAEAARRRRLYLGGRKASDPAGKTAIVVDDGVATGLTLRAAIRELRDRRPAQLVVAVPVIPPDTAGHLREEVDELVALEIPQVFMGAVGAYYGRFEQVSDEEVLALLEGMD